MSSENEKAAVTEIGKMSLVRQQLTSPLERLPLELRLRIYQAYLLNPNREYKDRLRYEKYARNNPTDPMQDDDANGVYTPFGIGTQNWMFKDDDDWRAITRRSPPALWQVGGLIASEARDYMLNERLNFECTDVWKRKEIVGEFDDFQAWMHHREAGGIRKAHLDAGFYCRSIGSSSMESYGVKTDFPLFKIETRDEGNSLTISSLYKLVDEQVAMLSQALGKAVGGCLGHPRTERFSGRDILEVVGQLLHVEDEICNRFFDFDDDSLADDINSSSPSWTVCLGADEVEKPIHGQHEKLPNERIVRKTKYSYEVIELRVQSDGSGEGDLESLGEGN